MVINKKLNCGIRMVMEQIPYVQSASVGIWVRTGSVDEGEKEGGISHFIEHMLFKGTESRTAKQIAWDMDRIGGNMNAFTGKEATCYYVKTLGSNLEQACDILIDMFLRSRFDPEEMEKEKSVICEEMKMIEDSPDEYSQDLLSESVFRGTRLESPIIGTRESLMGIQRADILDYLDREYTRDNIVVSLAGSFDPEAMCQYFEGRLAGLKAEKAGKSPVDQPYLPSFLSKVKDVEQSHISLGLRGVPMEDELYYSLSLLNNIMGGSMSSRLFQNIREEKGLAYSVYSAAPSYVDYGLYSIYAGVAKDKTADAVRGIAEELRNLKKDGVTEDELATAKEQMKSNYIFGLENVSGRMFAMGKNTLLLGRVKTPEEVIQNVDKVTMEEISKAADLISDIKNYCGVVVSGAEMDLESVLKGC